MYSSFFFGWLSESSVLKLALDLSVSAREADEVERVLLAFRGTVATNARAGALLCDRTQLRVHVAAEADSFDSQLPKAVLETAELLQRQCASADTLEQAVAQRALRILRRLLEEVR